MTWVRAAWSLGAVVVGFLFFLFATWWGSPLQNVAWAGPALGVAIAAMIVRAGVIHDQGRDGLSLLAAAAFASTAAVGGWAIRSVVKYAWGIAHSASSQGSPRALLGRLQDVAGSLWHEHWGSITLWAATALVPAMGAIALGVPALKRLLADSRDVKNGPWTSRWMTPAVLNQLAAIKVGLPLGRDSRGRLLRYHQRTLEWRGGHHGVIASTRAGKGVGAVLPAIIDHDGPTVVLDIKGENFAVTRRWRQSLGRQVIVLNPFGVVEPGAYAFNPIDYVRPDHLARDAAVIAEGLVKPESGAGAHFTDLASRLLAAAVEVVARVAEQGDRNLITIADMLLSGDIISVLEGWRDAPEHVGRSAAHVAAALLSAGDRERGAVMTTVAKSLAWCASDEMREFLSSPPGWSFDNILDDRADLFVVVPLDQVGPMSIFMRLTINLILGSVTRQDGHRTLAKPLLLVLDEFVRLGRMERFLDIATVGAGAGIEALFITQDRGQVEAIYGEDTSTLLGSCASVRVFGLGRSDTTTAKWIVDALGDRTVEVRGRQLDGKERPTGSEQRTKLLSIDELLELPRDEMIALFPGQSVARLKRIVSHTDPEYRGKLDPNPTLARK